MSQVEIEQLFCPIFCTHLPITCSLLQKLAASKMLSPFEQQRFYHINPVLKFLLSSLFIRTFFAECPCFVLTLFAVCSHHVRAILLVNQSVITVLLFPALGIIPDHYSKQSKRCLTLLVKSCLPEITLIKELNLCLVF